MDCSRPAFPVLHSLSEFAQTRVHWVGDAIQPSHPLSPPSPPALSLSQHQGLLQWVGSLHQVPKELELQHQSFHSEYSELISFRMDWLDLLAVQETLKSLLQHHSSKASILWPLAFFMVQLAHPYVTTGKTIALTLRTFVSKVMSLLFKNFPIWWDTEILSKKEKTHFDMECFCTWCTVDPWTVQGLKVYNLQSTLHICGCPNPWSQSASDPVVQLVCAVEKYHPGRVVLLQNV